MNAHEEPQPERQHLLRRRALARLRAATTYWLSTTRPDGRPHAMPVWGVWVDGAFWFGTAGQKVRNLAHQPYAIVHLESGDDVAIIEGRVERLESSAVAPSAVVAAFREKYVDGENGEPFDVAGELPADAALYRLRPAVGHAWLEGAFVETQTRWRFDAD